MTTVQRIAVGPELARQWIAHSAIAPRRHTIHEDKVHQFAELMRTGRWTDTWVPIMLDRDGNLVNGLHRLSAVVESGCTVVLNVATGFTSTGAANVRARNP
jgi:hypothetical protein